jgi:hypothetical protein
LLAVFPSGRAIEGIGLCDHLIVELKVELVGKVSLVDHDLLAFVGDEKGFGELGKVERCNPSLALGPCASELLILRPLMVDNVAICFGGLFLDGHESIISDHTPNASPKWPFYSFFLPRNSLSIKELRARGRAFPVTR